MFRMKPAETSKKGMLNAMEKMAWDSIFEDLVKCRQMKPRSAGLTMVIDKQSGLGSTKELLGTASPWIDQFKMGFGTSVFMSESMLCQKIELLVSAGILVFPGGTLTEAAWYHQRFDGYLKRAKELGFNGLEISDGTLNISDTQRQDMIKRALDAGFRVITEVGKKDPKQIFSPTQSAEQILSDLELGAENVIIEARESGRGVGVCKCDGTIKQDFVDEIFNIVGDSQSKIIWEAPLKEQHVFFITKLGPNVNLGNIAPAQVLELEAMRCNLRYETFRLLSEDRG